MTKEEVLQKVTDYCNEKSYTSATLTDAFRDKFADHFQKANPDADINDEAILASMKFAINTAFSSASDIVTLKTNEWTTKENDYKTQIQDLQKKVKKPTTQEDEPKLPEEVAKQLKELQEFKDAQNKQEKFAKNIPLALTGSICFEQMYNEIDGDSASSTELYALLSSLSNIPISQGIAVTGSVNQKGEIQSIGGVNEKIEGFFDICKSNGLTGSQGVIIPEKNVQNLNLNDEIIEAVKNHEFHIYAVSNIEEGIEILTGVPAGDIDIPGTINYLAYNTLKRFAKASKDMS